jgi:hypothetical protein
MRKMQNMKTYDIIRGRYKNQILEQKLIEQEKKEKEKKISGVRDKNYLVRNPLNNIIYDEEEQKRLDKIEQQKKQRFLAKENIDDYYHSMHNNIESQKLISHQHYFNPFEYRMNNKRGYDILTTKSQTIMEGNKYLTEIQTKKLETQWDKIKNNADLKHNTLKNIFKADYDENDIDLNYSNYLSKRKPILEQRAKTIDIIHKASSRNKNENKINPLIKSNEFYKNNVYNKFENLVNYNPKRCDTIDKDRFFGIPKNMLSSI